MTDRKLDVHDMIRQLTSDHPHTEPYLHERDNGEKWQQRHNTTVPALIQQLIGITGNAAGTGEESGAHKSKPAARIELLDTLILIDTEAGDWLDRLGYTIPANRIDANQLTIVGSGCILALSRLGGLYPSTDTCGRTSHNRDKGQPWCCARGHLAHDVRRWWYQARIITGWDTAAFKPRASCPVCDVHGSLRVKLEGAICVDCRTLWDTQQIGLLAEHIRTENGGEEPTDDAA